MIVYLANHVIITAWNFANSRIDAYRILKHKSIAHGINFGAYCVIVGMLIWVSRFDIKTAVLFGFSAFFNRQLSFDIPLNLRRGLAWYYQSTANPPKAFLDKIERKLFGVDYDGRKIAMWYGIFYFFTFVFKFA